MSRQKPAGPLNRELILKGELVLHRVASLKEEMQTALEGSDHVLLNLSEASTFDLAFLQLLCSAHRSAVLFGKSLSLTGTLPKDFHRRAEEAGFARHVGCRIDCQNSCIWMVQAR